MKHKKYIFQDDCESSNNRNRSKNK